MADEYIKRKDALDALTADALERNLDSVMTDTASRYHRAAQRVVSVVPAADVAPVRHGRWKKSYADHEAFGVRPFYRYCSECHEATVYPYNFCPNCGADMREVQDDG